jgi:mono/diheme cytochrome c family protein
MFAMPRKLLCLCLVLSAAVACGDDDDDHDDDHDHDAGDARVDGGPKTDGGAGSGMDGGVDGGLAAAVARGKYLVTNVAVCGDCHTPRKQDGSVDEDKLLSGIECFIDAVPGDDEAGCLHTRNLTNHETGLMNRSDQEIKDMFLKGVRPDDKAIHPIMPYYVLGNMSEDDADAIVAYLRTVPGVDHMVPPSQPPLLPPEMPAPRWPLSKIPMPEADYPDQAAAMRGRYLAGNIGICMECHTGRDDMGRVLVDKAFQGGNQFGRMDLGLPPIFPETIYSPNLTPHSTGIEGYTVEDIVNALKKGEDPNQDGAPLCPPMPAGPMGGFGGLTDADARDIAHYLLSIAPAENEIPEDCSAMPPDTDAGL